MFVSQPLSYSLCDMLCSTNVQANPSLLSLRCVWRHGGLWADFEGGVYIRIQCQLREKSGVFLVGAWRVAGLGVDRFYRSGVSRKMGDWTV